MSKLDPATIIADLLATSLMPCGQGGRMSTWRDARQPYGWERDGLDYLAERKRVGDRPPINAWTAWLVEEGYPPAKAGPDLHGKFWKPDI